MNEMNAKQFACHTLKTQYQLSPMQQGMLIDYLVDPKTGVYIQQLIGTFHEELDVAAYQKAWENVVARHPTLRTSIQWEGIDKPLQIVHSKINLQFESYDWCEVPSAIQEEKFDNFVKQDRQQSFDLSQAPLLRLTLFKFNKDLFKLLWTIHHIIADGRSYYLILKDVYAFYDAYCHGNDIRLADPIPFHKHIDSLYEKDLFDSKGYWQELLKDFTAPTSVDVLPKIESLHPGEFRYETKEIKISNKITEVLKNVARKHDITLNTMVQGAWGLLLSRYTGTEDIVFGAVRACRRSTVDEAESIVGLFINNLPVRVRIQPDCNLIPWLQDLRKQHILVRDHEHTPLVEVLGWSDVPRRTPLFESYVVFDNYELNDRLRENGGNWKNRDFQLIEETGYPLTLYGYGGSKLSLKISFDKSRLDGENVERMIGHLKTLLESMAENQDRSIASLPILTKEERHQLLVEWNDTQADYPNQFCLHELFEEQVEQSNNAIAVQYEGVELTYREFNKQSNQLARKLRKLGVGPDALVGVFMERSIEMVISLYGILKAGGAYVPLDPEYPPERVGFMLEDTQVSVLLTQQKLVSKLPNNEAKVICLDSDWKTISKESGENLENQTTPENLAYVIYTSGSTGRPKGVMNTHRGICNRLLWMQATYQLTKDDRILQKTPFSFDVSVWEFFWPLLFGARLVVARPGGHKDSTYLINLIVEQNITTIHFVPSMLQLFLEDKNVRRCTCLRQVICSGEALPYELQQRFFARLKSELHNLYGPTEAAVDVSYWQCRPDIKLKIVPIGRPVANTQLYILDRLMQPVPIGVAGELHIGGIQVARGYLNRPELTTQKFIPDPFSNDPKARLYKTGDSVRFLPDGNIEFLGRLDFQVKIRGFRIELGEIESVLSQYPAIREVVVLARDDVPRDIRLVAYFISIDRSSVNISDLRNYLKEKLPDYMIPVAYVQLESMPLNPNGKIDRKSLPVPDTLRLLDKNYVAPQSELEKTLVKIWQELLQIEKVGVEDNFFDLGGHSLLIMQAHQRLSDLTDHDLTITDMFRFPTIRTLSMYLTQESEEINQDFMKKSIHRAHARREALIRRHQRRK